MPKLSEKTIVLLAILFSVCFITLLWFLNQKNETITPVNTTIPVSTISQKTYKNIDPSFELEYPSTWKIDQEALLETGDYVYLASPNQSVFRVDISEDNSKTISEYLSKIDKQNLTGYEGKPSITVISTKKTIVANLNCIQRVENYNAAGFSVYSTYFKNGNNIYVLTLQPNEGALIPDDINIYQQILSTFKFTENKVITPTKIQTLIKSIKYNLPPNWLSVRDNSQLFEVGYNTVTQDIKMDKQSISVIYKNLNNNPYYSPYASTQFFQVLPYNNGSRHTFIEKQLGETINSGNKSPGYYESEMNIDGKSCLVLNGISISQFYSVWGMCAINTKQALLFNSFNYADLSQHLNSLKFKL
jgi:hypothetical protein